VKSAEDAIEDAKKAINEGGVARLRSATETLERSLHKIAEDLYKTSQAAGGGEQAGAAGAGAGAPGGAAGAGPSPAGGPQGGKPGDVIDAEYVDVDENKRPN
jgi:molecular chaperone DnaK